jgi:GNAT superfamily N-acetyltransferase
LAEEIRQTYTLPDEEKQRLYGWGEDIFGAASLNLKWRPKSTHFLFYDGGLTVSHVGLLRHEVSVAGRPVLVAGVGGVVTVPEAQGKGIARRLMEHAATFFEREWRVDAGMLFCFERLVPFYRSLGWQIVNSPVFIEQPAGKIESPLLVMVIPCDGGAWAEGPVELNGLPW